MKTMKLTAALLALASIAVLGNTSAKAYANGDLLLGVYDTTNTIATNYEVDLGSITTFAGYTTQQTFNVSADLASIYTSNSVPLTSLTWAVAGSTYTSSNIGTYAARTNFLSYDESTPGTEGSPITSLSNTTTSTNINNEASTFRSASTPGSFANSEKISSGNLFKTEVNASGGNYGYGSSAPDGVLNKFDTSTTNFVSDLDVISPTGVSTVLGTFTFNDLGELIYDPNVSASVPEPSTYALMGIGALFFVWALRRRSAKA